MNNSFLKILAGWWWVPALILCVSVVASIWWTSLQPRVYRASAMLVVVPNSSVGDAEVLRSIDALERRTLLATFARLAATPETRTAVAGAVKRAPGEARSYQIGASVLPNTNIIRIDVDGPDPDLAAKMANAAGEVAGGEVRSLYRIYTMRPIAAAEASTRPIHPDPRRNSLAAGVVGLFIGTLVVGVMGTTRREPSIERT